MKVLENTQRLRVIIGLISTCISYASAAWAQQVALQDVGNNNPINCAFGQYNYCQSRAALNGPTTFAPVSDPPQNSIVHFSYRGSGNSNYLTWPTNFRASSANGISHSPTLV